MKKGILAVIAVVVVVGLLGIGWWLIRDRDEGGTEDVQPVQHSPKLTPEQRAEAVRVAVEKNRHWWREASYVQIRQAAMDGDRVAQRRLSEVYDDCMAFRGPLSSNMKMLARLRTADPHSKAAIRGIFNDFRRMCVQADADLTKNPQAGLYWLHSSAKAGDLTAQMRYVNRTSQRISEARMRYFIEEIANTGDPDALFEVVSLLPRMRDTWSEPAQALAFDNVIGSQAWMLVACASGYDCTSGSRMMRLMCVGMFACDQPDFMSYYRANPNKAIDPAKVNATIAVIRGSLLQWAAPPAANAAPAATTPADASASSAKGAASGG